MPSIPLVRRLVPIAVLVVLAACGSDGGSAGGGTIDDRDAWCATIGDVDQRFKAVDTSDDSFEVKQAGYERIGELIGDLEDGIAVVDASERDEVRASLDWASRLTDVLVASDDERDATRRVEPMFDAVEEENVAAGAPWIRTHCGVDIDN